ncbi:MAG: hypothetical protein U1C72_02350, partial [Candidatus Pacearchaeota archaeon]|nr:hypothetical protein [Candidatus Pacearchaeota archaeon]
MADILPKSEPLGAQLKEAANRLLTSLILLTKENLGVKEQGQNVAPRAIREFGILIAYLNYARRVTKVNPKNFVILEKEYSKIGE